MIQYFKRIIGQTLIYGAGDMVIKIISVLLIPLYARFLTPDAYGAYAIIYTFFTVLTLILSLGFNSAIIKVYHDKSNSNSRHIMSTSMLVLLTAGLPATLLLLLLAPWISTLFFNSAVHALHFRLVFLAAFFDLFRMAGLTWLRIREKSWLYAAINSITFAVLIALNILTVAVWHWGITGILSSHFMTTAVTGLILGIYTWIHSGHGFSRPLLKQLLQFGLPLVPSAVAGWGMTMMAIQFLHFYADDYQVGLYHLCSRFGMIINMLLVRPFRTAWLPFAFSIQHDDQAKRVYGLTLTYFVLGSAFVFLGLTLFSRELVTLLATEKYIDGLFAVPIIAGAFIFYGMYYIVDIGILLNGKTKYYTYVLLITASIQVAASFIFIPVYKMMGAAIVTLLSYLLLFAGTYFTAQKLYPVSYEWRRLIQIILLTGLLLIAGLMIPAQTVWLSIVFKALLLLAFPLLLRITRFLHPQEWDALKKGIQKFQTERQIHGKKEKK